MQHSLFKTVGRYDTYLKSNNMVLSNYEGTTSAPLGVIQVDVVVGIITRLTLFVVIPTKANYNSFWVKSGYMEYGVFHLPYIRG